MKSKYYWRRLEIALYEIAIKKHTHTIQCECYWLRYNQTADLRAIRHWFLSTTHFQYVSNSVGFSFFLLQFDLSPSVQSFALSETGLFRVQPEVYKTLMRTRTANYRQIGPFFGLMWMNFSFPIRAIFPRFLLHFLRFLLEKLTEFNFIFENSSTFM